MNNSNESLGQMCLEDLLGPAFSDGRTCQAPYPAEPKRVQTLEKSYHPLSASSKKSTPIFLYLRGGWHNAGLLDGDGWQVAWRILDSQYVGGGTAQRRRRLFVIADFGGHRAGEILFKPASVPWNYSAVMQAWKDTSRSLDERIAEASRIIGCRTRSDENGSVTFSRPVFRESSDRFESDRAVRHCEDSGSAVWNGRGQHTIDLKYPGYTLKVRGGGRT